MPVELLPVEIPENLKIRTGNIGRTEFYTVKCVASYWHRF